MPQSRQSFLRTETLTLAKLRSEDVSILNRIPASAIMGGAESNSGNGSVSSYAPSTTATFTNGGSNGSSGGGMHQVVVLMKLVSAYKAQRTKALTLSNLSRLTVKRLRCSALSQTMISESEC